MINSINWPEARSQKYGEILELLLSYLGVFMRFNLKAIVLTVSFFTLVLVDFGCSDGAGSGPKAPEFRLSDLEGEIRSLSEFKGNVVVLDFWATWCPPCRMSIPELVKLQGKYGDRGLVILGVSVDDPMRVTDEHLRVFKEKASINYAILRYNQEVIRDYFGQKKQAIPTMFLIDRDGRIKDKFVGYDPGALEESLSEIL